MSADASETKGHEPLLSVRDLRTYFPVTAGRLRGVKRQLRAVDGVDLDIDRGTTLGLVGESGCGKTTLGRTILGLEQPAGGSVHFDGVDVLRASGVGRRNLTRRMQMIFQDATGSLNPRMKVGDIVAEPMAIHSAVAVRKRPDRVAELLERVGLRCVDADRYPHELSGGQRQRVGIARAIALSPEFIVCDEPVSALDVSVQSQVLNLLSDLKHELNLTYLFVAHNLAVVRHLGDRSAVMYLGKIVEIGHADDVYDTPSHPYTQALLSAVPEIRPGRRGPYTALSGDVPSPVDPPSGCAFHPRCPLATDKCREVSPVLEAKPGLTADHLVACHHVEAPAARSKPSV